MTERAEFLTEHDIDAPVEAASAGPGRPLRCLLVEDSRFDRSLVRYSAERGGIDIEFTDALTLAEARDSLAAQDFELVILDRGLPDGDGLDLQSEMASLHRNSGIPTIMLTGGNADELGPESVRAGCAGFIAKDELSPEGLAGAVRAALAEHAGVRGDGSSEELRLLLGAFSDVSRAARMKPLAARLMTVVSELRHSLADTGPHLDAGALADARSAVEEISELTLMLWMDMNGAEREQPATRTYI